MHIPPGMLFIAGLKIWTSIPCSTDPSVWIDMLKALMAGEFAMFTPTVRVEPTVKEVLSNVVGVEQSVTVGLVTQTWVGVTACAKPIDSMGARSISGMRNSILVFFKYVAPFFSDWLSLSTRYKSFQNGIRSL
jgi:hypothetical protein